MIFKEISVNTLYLALLISTYPTGEPYYNSGADVSMPSILGCSFLRGILFDDRGHVVGCQCPLSWAAHFYVTGMIIIGQLSTCVNALYLGLLISTSIPAWQYSSLGSCQCPLSWAAHFYFICRQNDGRLHGCQCPLSWAAHFYIH